MTAITVIEALLDGKLGIQTRMSEASVHLPPRGTVWIASFTGPTPGERVWRSTGLRNRTQALALARKFEFEARQQRMAFGHRLKKPSVRVRPGRDLGAAGPFTQKEVAQILNMSERGVREIERRAFAKLRRDPLLRRIWQQHLAGELDENTRRLTAAEIAALFALTQSPSEVRVIQKVLRTIRS